MGTGPGAWVVGRVLGPEGGWSWSRGRALAPEGGVVAYKPQYRGFSVAVLHPGVLLSSRLSRVLQGSPPSSHRLQTLRLFLVSIRV